MNFKIQDVPYNSMVQFAFGAICCCLITYQVKLAISQEYTMGSFAIILIPAILFLGMAIWFFWMYVGDRKIAVMPRKVRIVVEIVDIIITIIWNLTLWFPKTCHPAWAIVSWSLLVGAFLYYLIYCSKHKVEE